MKCKMCNLIMDRDIAAVLNIQMRGAGPQRALNELIEREGLSRGNDYLPLLSPEPMRRKR
jgi:transposase